jgi:predicted nucleic acid-binding protein
MKWTLLDAGPLVAYLSARDHHHEWAVRQFAALQPPLITCEPVLAEACFLLQRNAGNPREPLKFLQRGIFQIALEVQTEAAGLESFMERYADTPMSLADACLVRLAEIYADSRVFTVDSDFQRYRKNGRQIIPLLAPW